PARWMDSGITSRNATASIYPAPSAKKYCKNCRGQSRRTTKYPPIKFPAAATSPNPAASAVRNAKSCPIVSGTGFSLCLRSHQSCARPIKHVIPSEARNLLFPLFSAISLRTLRLCVIFSLFSFPLGFFLYFLISLPLSFIRCAETKSHPPLARYIPSLRASPAPSPALPQYSPQPEDRSTSPLPPE